MLLLFLDFLKFLFSKIMNIDVVYITDVPISRLMSSFVQMETDVFFYASCTRFVGKPISFVPDM